eukprot:gene6655-3319_t
MVAYGPMIGPMLPRVVAQDGQEAGASSNGLKAHADHGYEHDGELLELNITSHTHPVWKRLQPVGAGLDNLGNSCYLNSVLQCLAHIPPLGNLLSHQFCLHGFACPLSRTYCTACMLEDQLKRQLGCHGQAVRPSAIFNNLERFSKSFVRGRQEDSHELLISLIDAVERDIHLGYARSIGLSKGREVGDGIKA